MFTALILLIWFYIKLTIIKYDLFDLTSSPEYENLLTEAVLTSTNNLCFE